MVTTARPRPGFEALALGGSGTSTNAGLGHHNQRSGSGTSTGAEQQPQRERPPDENDAALCGREPLLFPARALRVGAPDDEPAEPDDVRAPEPFSRERCWPWP